MNLQYGTEVESDKFGLGQQRELKTLNEGLKEERQRPSSKTDRQLGLWCRCSILGGDRTGGTDFSVVQD